MPLSLIDDLTESIKNDSSLYRIENSILQDDPIINIGDLEGGMTVLPLVVRSLDSL